MNRIFFLFFSSKIDIDICYTLDEDYMQYMYVYNPEKGQQGEIHSTISAHINSADLLCFLFFLFWYSIVNKGSNILGINYLQPVLYYTCFQMQIKVNLLEYKNKTDTRQQTNKVM